MCGIVGILHFDRERPVSEPLLRSMCRTLHHRGPDDEGLYVKGPVGLAVRRLSVIDISGGHQPPSNETGTSWVAFNGEIYNFQTLRKGLKARGHHFRTNSDTEVIVHGYEEYGQRWVEDLAGMFAIAVWDEVKRKLILARDRLGEKPLFYCQDRERFVFASEIKAILHHPKTRRDIDLVALDDYLHHGFIPGPRTIYRHIRKLPQAHCAVVSPDGKMKTERYWEFPRPQVATNLSETDYLEKLAELLDDVVRTRLISDVPLGAFLSGGLDSSVVAAEMSRNMTQPVNTYTIGFAETGYDETAHARHVATHLGTKHHEYTVSGEPGDTVYQVLRQFDEPFADSSAFPTYHLAKFTRQHVTVALAGEGGDEVFGGYSRYVGRRWTRAYLRVPRSLRRTLDRILAKVPEGTQYKAQNLVKQVKWFVNDAERSGTRPLDLTVSLFSRDAQKGLLHPDVQAALEQIIRPRALSFVEEVASGYDNLDSISQMMWTDAQTYLVDNNLLKVDRMSMAHSLEVRSPFLDHRLIEFMARLPVHLKVRGTRTKHLLKRHAEALLPHRIAHRRKHGFSAPIGKWLLTPLRPLADDFLLGTQSLLLNNKALEELLEQHRRGKADLGQQIWSLLVLRLWERENAGSPGKGAQSGDRD